VIVAVLPAHQEEAGITQAVESLRCQTLAPDRIIVAADNCTDRTVELALAAGAEVFETVGNTSMKAGALNQALATLTFDSADLVLVMDADTTLAPKFLQIAVERLDVDAGLAAVGGVFTGVPSNLVGRLQANEWLRYARQLKRTGRVQVLSGTAAVIRQPVLEAVRQARGGLLPGREGDVYNADAATEDFCLTVALKTLGYRLASPSGCQTVTELMPSYRMLWAQRTRWYGGALQVLGMFGVRRSTLPYIAQQAMLILAVLGMAAYLALTGLLLNAGQLGLSAWGVLGVIFWVERVVTVWAGGARARLLAALFIPELLYDLFLQAAFVASAVGRLRGRRIGWVHCGVPIVQV
jgi:cellulose synthase/poly-beta-1,6-N-acetylglucosamine synthase-like glycosyltransferase